jgi:type VI secretion system secreted protein VgrG
MAIERAANTAVFHFEVGGVPEGELAVYRFRASEGLSQLFTLDVELVSEDPQIAFEKLLGQEAKLRIETRETSRHLKGIVSRFEQGAVGTRYARYYARIVPAVWKLEQRIDCRIFQDMTVENIVSSVLEGAGIPSDSFEFRTQGEFKQREYCVQYRESDWSFVSRLLEDEGVFYFFEYDEGGAQTLVFADGSTAYGDIPGESTEVPYNEPRGQVPAREYVSKFRVAAAVRTGSVAIKDFSFKTPKVVLEGSQASGGAFDELELYDSPAELFESSHVRRQAAVRLEELQALTRVGTGESVCHRLTPGHTFSLTEHGRADFNAEYVVAEVVHQGYEPEALRQERPDDDDEKVSYENDFRCIPADVNFRPPRLTPRPYIRGTQSATVTGPSGEEIYCDEFGRIKVQFHWDRQGEHDDRSSCFVRVSQQWAGPGYGFQTLPRIGNEVIVAFFEGNPDRPHIIGRVYNAENMPPYSLPDNKNQTGIKSESTKGGDGYNEIMLDDTKGSELFRVQAEKDMATLVKNDQTHSVGNDRTRDVGNDETVTIGANRHVTVGTDHTEEIGENETLSVGADRSRTVTSNETVSVGEDQTLDIAGKRSLSVGDELNETIGTSQTTDIGNDLTITVGGDQGTSVTGDSLLEADTIQLVARSELSIKVGSARLVMKSNGDISLDGKKINVKGSSDVIIKGSKIKQN